MKWLTESDSNSQNSAGVYYIPEVDPSGLDNVVPLPQQGSTTISDLVYKLAHWLTYGVMITLLPIIFNLIIQISKGEAIGPKTFFAGGELFLVCAAISAEALGEVHLYKGAKNNSFLRFAELVCFSGCLTILLISAFWFAIVKTSATLLGFDEAITSTGSILMLIMAVLVGGGAKVISESWRLQ